MIEHLIRSHGVHVQAYELSHSGEAGEAVIFLHYLNGLSHVWCGVWPYFTAKYRVVALDFRGHGLSDVPRSAEEWRLLPEDVLAVMEALGIERAHLVGSSLGCFVGLELAAKHPERVLSLTLSDGAMQNFGGPGGKWTEEEFERITRNILAQPEEAYSSREAYLEHLLATTWVGIQNPKREEIFQAFARALRQREDGLFVSPITPAMNVEGMRMLYQLALEPLYENVRCPVLFLPAEQNTGLAEKLAFIEQVSGALPFSKTVVIPGTPHNMMKEHFHEMSAEIAGFLEEWADKQKRS